jgi:hypothetical protein
VRRLDAALQFRDSCQPASQARPFRKPGAQHEPRKEGGVKPPHSKALRAFSCTVVRRKIMKSSLGMTALSQSRRLGSGPQKMEKGVKPEKDVKIEETNSIGALESTKVSKSELKTDWFLSVHTRHLWGTATQDKMSLAPSEEKHRNLEKRTNEASNSLKIKDRC